MIEVTPKVRTISNASASASHQQVGRLALTERHRRRPRRRPERRGHSWLNADRRASLFQPLDGFREIYGRDPMVG
jgi:hypothetical protein